MSCLKAILLSYFLFVSANIKAQDKQKCFLIAFAQKSINAVCGTGELVKSEPWELSKKRIIEQTNKWDMEFKEKYSSKNGYSDRLLKVVTDDQVIIYYKTTRVYIQNIDQWNCTSTYYGVIIDKTFADAEKELERLKLKNKKISYAEVGRWPQK